MKTMFNKVKVVVSTLFVALLFVSCQDEMEDYYEEPSWLSGSIQDVLEGRGDYTIFLKGAEIADLKPLLEGRSIMTVMAPDDEAFRSYLQANYGTTSIEDLEPAEVKKLIGFHCLYYSFDKEKLINFRPNEGDAATEDEKMSNAGMYFKFRTHSQDAATREQPARMFQVTNETTGAGEIKDTTGVTVDVYHLERFIPVFSYKMFETKLIDAKKNYEYFFPDTEWKGDGGFNVANAAVDEYGVIAKNGYIYFVDRVIRPLETIHTELERNPAYSFFLNLYDQYSYYKVDDELTNTYGGGTATYYQRLYESRAFPLVNIASEWPVSSYLQMSQLSSVAYSVFAPTNSAFEGFYRDYWGLEGTGYPQDEVSYDSVSSDAIGYLLSNCICDNIATGGGFNYLAFPDEITSGKIINAYTNMPVDFDPWNAEIVPETNRKICVNGVLYGQNIITPPAVFGSVSGPAYQYKKYSTFLQMLTNSDMLSTLCSDAVSFIALYPSNAQFEANNIWYDAASSKLKFGTVGSTSASNLSSSAQQNFVYSHIVSLDNTVGEPLPTGTGVKVYRTFSPNYKLYWYVKDGKITNSFKYNSLIQYAGNMDVTKENVYTDVQELTFRGAAWSNGHCYEYDTQNQTFLLEGTNDNAIYANFVPLMYAHRNDEGTLFQGFIQMLILADMMDRDAGTMNYMTEDCMMLVPTTEAIKEAIVGGRFPYVAFAGSGVDDADFWSKCSVSDDSIADFQHYMMQYFLPESTAPCSNYPYPGWGENIERDGGIPSIADLSVTPAANALIFVTDANGKLQAKAGAGNDYIDFLPDYDYLPFVFDDGCVQFLDGIFVDAWPKP